MIKKYIEDNKMKAHFIEENLFDIDGAGRFLFLPERDVMITSDYELNIEREEKNTECDFYVFPFGKRIYYTSKKSWKKPLLNLFRYLGKSTDDESTFAMLGVRGAYERLNGSGSYEKWAEKAKFLGCSYLGLCEKNSLSGAIKFQSVCKKNGIKSIIGATYSVLRDNTDLKYDVKCFVKNQQGWQDILKINNHVRVLTKGYIKETDFFKLKSNLTVILDPKKVKYEDTFPLDLGGDFYYQLDTVEYSKNEDDKEFLENLKKFIRDGKFKPIIAYDAYYLDKDDAYIKEALNSISNSSKDDEGSITSVNEKLATNQYFKSIIDFYDELSFLFNIDDDSFDELWDEAYSNMFNVCRVKFEIDTSHRFLPEYKMTEEEKEKYEDNWDLFYSLIEKGFEAKVPKGKYDEYQKRLETEIDVIDLGNVMNYFLILWDIIRWCESNNMLLGFGRGSSAGALIAYLLNITKVDPIEHGLLFERFLNKGRVTTSLPDIDSDFSSDDRPKVKKYIIEKYGDGQVCSVGTYGNLRIKSAIKYFAKLYGCSDNSYLNTLTKFVFDLPSGSTVSELMEIAVKTERGKQFVESYPEVIQDMILSINQPISEGVHAGAVIIVPDGKNIWDYFPVKRMTLKDGTEMFASEWEGGEMEDVGYLKLDILGLKELDKLRFMLDMIKEQTGEEIDIYKIPFDNKEVFQYFQNGWNQDVFQFGTPLFVKYLRQLKPENIDDLIAAVALGRPGPMENNFHNEYVMRKNGEKEIEYMWGCEDITKNTYGILCYQEQIMLICQQIGGFSLIEAESIRKALGKKLMDLLESYKDKFVSGAKEKDCPEDNAVNIWDAMVEFAKYSFNLSHAVCYAKLGYVTQWMKVNYPIYFWAAAFEKIPSGKNGEMLLPKYISEVNKSGAINILPPDINKSRDNIYIDVYKNIIYWTLTSIKNVGDTSSDQIIDLRADRKYFSFGEFLQDNVKKGSKVTKLTIERLVLGGVFDEFEEIQRPCDRMKLINQFREDYEVKIKKKDEEKDLFLTNEDKLHLDWWWQYQQKVFSGYSEIGYKSLAYLNGKNIEDDYPYVDHEDFMDDENIGENVTVAGYVYDFVIRDTRRGKMASIMLDINYDFIKVTIWNQQYEKIKEIVDGCGKKIIVINGVIRFDSYIGENALYSDEKTSIQVLD